MVGFNVIDSPKGMVWYMGRVLKDMLDCCVKNSPKVMMWFIG